MPLDYELIYTPDALQMMDSRMILKSDVEAVIHAMRESGQAIEDSESGYLMACHRSGNVTFWVALTETDAGYVVHRAYSHRMNVVKRN